MTDVRSGNRGTDVAVRDVCVPTERHRDVSAAPDAAACMESQLARLEDAVYISLIGLADEARLTAAACGDDAYSATRALLVASDVESRSGQPERALETQLQLLEQTQPWPALHRRVMTMLSTTTDRLGRRTEAARWIDQAMQDWDSQVEPRWRAEAMMIFTLGTLSHGGADFGLAHEAARAVRNSGSAVLQSVTLANFAELATELDMLDEAVFFADAASAVLCRHPETVLPLSLDSIANARIASGEFDTAERNLRLALSLEPSVGYTDIHGEPRLTLARLLLARSMPAEAMRALDDYAASGRGTPWMHCTAAKLRGEASAALGHWRDAYDHMAIHLEMYERLRSVESDREVIASESRQMASEHRNRADELARIAFTDSLTGLPNRRSMQQWLDELSDRDDPIAIGIVDLDHFKAVNDQFGHDTGDEVLRVVARVLLERADVNVRVARLGGEEFVAVFRHTTEHEVRRWAEGLRRALAAVRMDDIAPNLRITASIGVALGQATESRALLKAADTHLYRAKSSGRNRVAA